MLPNNPHGTEFFQVRMKETPVTHHIIGKRFGIAYLAGIEYFKILSEPFPQDNPQPAKVGQTHDWTSGLIESIHNEILV
jgi:hypothetical protein